MPDLGGDTNELIVIAVYYIGFPANPDLGSRAVHAGIFGMQYALADTIAAGYVVENHATDEDIGKIQR